MWGERVREKGTGAGEMEGTSLVLEKNDSDDCCGDPKERSSNIVFHIPCYSWHYIGIMQM